MNRTNFFNEATVFGTKELDYLWSSFSEFQLKYDPVYYRVVGGDAMRPDKISFKNYGTPDFWWVICVVNDINNPLTEIVPGQVLAIPNQLDIFDFQRKHRIRRNK